MKKSTILVFAICLAALIVPVVAQTPQLIKRTITKTDSFEFGAGGTVAITGAPVGSIRIEGTSNNQIEITAAIELQAANEADLDRLAGVTGFLTDESPSRTGIVSAGTYNKPGDKKMWKKFPKNLMGLPFRIDYVIQVPKYCDLEIDGGQGDLSIKGVNGSMRINFVESDAKIEVIGGTTAVTIASGTVDIDLGVKGWAGRPAAIQLGTGRLTVRLPSNMSSEIDATILRTGAIENMLTDLKPRHRKVPFTEKSISAKAGVGGASLKFSVGDGTLKMERLVYRQ